MHKTTLPSGGSGTSYPPPNDVVLPPTLESHRRGHDPPSCMVTTHTAAAAFASWLRHRRIRYFLLLLCSPLLLVVLCAALPFLCAAELWLRRRGLWRKFVRRGDTAAADDCLLCNEEGCRGGRGEDREEKGLLHRYLEDQLLLIGSMYECGNDDEEQEQYSRC